MICPDCRRDVVAYTALGIWSPVEHECPGELVRIRRDERDALKARVAELEGTLQDILEDVVSIATRPAWDACVAIRRRAKHVLEERSVR